MAASAPPDLGRLRRFSLAVGIVLAVYSSAGVTLDPDRAISLFGLPLKVATPSIITFGLVIASIYGLVRFWYYGVMLTESPGAMRRRHLRHIKRVAEGPGSGPPWTVSFDSIDEGGFYPVLTDG